MSSTDSTDYAGEAPRYGDYSSAFVDADLVTELGVWRWDLAAGTIELSERLRQIFGLGQDGEAISLELFLDAIDLRDRASVQSEMEAAILAVRPFSWQARLRLCDGEPRTILSTGSPTADSGEAVAELVGICRDISRSASAESKLGQLERRLTDILANSPSMISIKDLDRRYRMANKNVADLAGRPLDEIIGHTATEIFPAPVGAAMDAQAAESIATRQTIQSDVELEIDGQRHTLHVVSFALLEEDGEPVEVCTIANDVTDSRHRSEQTRLRREAGELIGAALADDRLIAVSQPVVDISGDTTVSAELLIRLALPGQAGLLQPGAFLPLAERFGLVQDIDIWMVNRALGLAADRKLQVNLSAITFSDPGARETIISGLQRQPDAAVNMVFEITETAVAHHLDAACEFASALTELGCGLALDDFGTGFGSFTYLRRLPLRYLKIDRSFVTGLPGSHDDRRVVSSIIGIAKQFDLWTIAEGVEDAETLVILRQLGADYAQGFHLGRPGPLSDDTRQPV